MGQQGWSEGLKAETKGPSDISSKHLGCECVCSSYVLVCVRCCTCVFVFRILFSFLLGIDPSLPFFLFITSSFIFLISLKGQLT